MPNWIPNNLLDALTITMIKQWRFRTCFNSVYDFLLKIENPASYRWKLWIRKLKIANIIFINGSQCLLGWMTVTKSNAICGAHLTWNRQELKTKKGSITISFAWNSHSWSPFCHVVYSALGLRHVLYTFSSTWQVLLKLHFLL